MIGKETTAEEVEKVLEMHRNGDAHGVIRKATNLPGNTITRIINGWRPTGRKPVVLTKAVDYGFINRRSPPRRS
jgi:hypothetical protein